MGPSVSPRRVGAGKPPPDAPLALWQIADSSLHWDENDGLSLLPESALEAGTACQDFVLDKLRERRDLDVQEGEKEKEDVELEDSLNVDEISEFFSSVEQEELSGVDFSVFIEDDDAINVEKISEMCSDLKTCGNDESEVTVSSPVDVVDTKQLEAQTNSVESSLVFDSIAADQDQQAVDAGNVTMLSEILSATLEDKDTVDVEADLPPTYSLADYEDAKRVDLMADLFTSLEESSDADQEAQVADRSATRDWIDALEVDNVSSLFSELEQVEKMQMKTETKEKPSTGKVDSRVFVPKFSVRIEDLQRPGQRRPAVGPNSHLLVGPPSVFSARPHAPSRQERVGRWKSKRKAQPLSTKKTDPTISDTRRASAAKRQRVKGRFVSDTHTFVSITALQS
ncbi:hypothetical protein P3T76_007073 [Phytophthora citrophthora]|uniref:CCT domain-containing protein n=1 Tax=Phytophthora citrophthora TaxID=4793 RepID=A0AAD9GMB8_9STRA|nr:hypothetical protein P3T76_007073 [Phytophthora citrophthora]